MHCCADDTRLWEHVRQIGKPDIRDLNLKRKYPDLIKLERHTTAWQVFLCAEGGHYGGGVLHLPLLLYGRRGPGGTPKDKDENICK